MLRPYAPIGVDLRDPDCLVQPSFRRKPESSLTDKSLDPGFRRADDEEDDATGTVF